MKGADARQITPEIIASLEMIKPEKVATFTSIVYPVLSGAQMDVVFEYPKNLDFSQSAV